MTTGRKFTQGTFPASFPDDLPPALVKHLQLRIARLPCGASMILPPVAPARQFDFERDTFSFANELVWEYRLDPATGSMVTLKNNPPRPYTHRCFVMVRSARQFFYHARFEARQPPVAADSYRRLIRQVVGRSPRQPSREPDKIVFPGYDGLRAFSQAHEALLKAECGGAWQSYVLRSHWRMVFPISRRHQENISARLLESFDQRAMPIVHLVRFPQLTINHGIVLFGHQETETEILFAAYDPNQPGHPTQLVYRRTEQTFHLPRNHYWAGGRVDVIEVFRGWIY